MIFKCKNCGGNTVYSPEHKGMFCPYCDSEKSEERTHDLYHITNCPDCYGELNIEEHTSALQCPYCDNYIILNDRVEGEFLPDKLILFKYSKEMVKNLMREKFKKCIFAPTDFLSEARLDSMRGEYIPFWLFDYNTHCDFRGEGVKVRSWRSSDIEYTETSYYSLVRDMDISYKDIPADASVKMPDQVMDLMEPYDYTEFVPFSPEYMSGFDGEKYNMASELAEPRAGVKMKKSAEVLLDQSISGYLRVTTGMRNIYETDRNAEYGLLPVWKYIYKYQDKLYPFYINGQTGKVVGKVPVSAKKVIAYGITLWAVLTILLLLIGCIAGL